MSSDLGGQAASVRFENVTKAFGDVVAVDGISFEIEAGNLVTLLGPSGCGKTTTLRIIAGLEMVNRGRILIGGRDVTLLPATDRDVSMVFQSYALFPHMTVIENVSYGFVVSGMRKEEARTRAPGAGAGPARGLRRPPAERAFRRPAAARRGRPRTGAGARGAAVRRAAV